LLVGARPAKRCVAGSLAFPASSLALSPTRLAPDDDGPSRHSASRHRSTSIAADGSSTHKSAPLRSPFLLHGPTHAGLLSWGRTGRAGLPRPPGPIAPPSALHLLAKDRCASTPGHGPKSITFGLRMPIRKSRSDRVVSHHLAGFLRARARRLVASCSRPWGSPRFTRTSRSQPKIPATRPPLEGLSQPLVVLRSPGALAPLAFDLADADRAHTIADVSWRESGRDRHLRGIVRADGL
jgi:hypothetical protein